MEARRGICLHQSVPQTDKVGLTERSRLDFHTRLFDTDVVIEVRYKERDWSCRTQTSYQETRSEKNK